MRNDTKKVKKKDRRKKKKGGYEMETGRFELATSLEIHISQREVANLKHRNASQTGRRRTGKVFAQMDGFTK